MSVRLFRLRYVRRFGYVLLVFALAFGVLIVAIASDVEDWPMFRHDSQHTGHSISARPNTNRLLWSYATSGAVKSSPAVVNGRVYVGSDDGNVYCLNASMGTEIWNCTIGSEPAEYLSSPAVDGDMVYVGSYTGKVYGLRASDGLQVWNFTTGDRVYSSPAAVDGRVYIGAYDGNGVYCLDGSTGVKLWNHATGGQVWSSPAVFEDRVYVGSIQDHGVYCLNASDGTRIWNYTTGGEVWSSPAVADGKVYVGSNDNRTYCLDSVNGTVIWSHAAGNLVLSSPAVADGRVYVGSHDANVYCMNDSTGTLVWNYTTGGIVMSSPAFADGRVYVGCYDNKIYCLDASTGAHVWNYTTGNYIISSPAIVNGRLYVGSADQGVYCLGPNTTATVPLFELVSEEKTEFEGGANLTYTFRDLSFSATAGNVWIPEERVVCDVPLVNDSSGAPTGNLSESALSLDINGDGDTSDVFIVKYVDNSTAKIEGVTAYAQLPPHRRIVFPTVEGYGIYYVYDETNFQLGAKSHTLHRITYPTGDNIGYAEFGLDSTFKYHSGPCLELILEQLGASLNSSPSAELLSIRLNGSVLPVESLQPQASPHGEEQWLVDKMYACSLGALEKDDVFTLELSIRGEPGTYLLMANLNWSPDSVSRYMYPNVDAFTLTGTVHQSIPFGNTAYSIDTLTNCTVPQGIAYKWMTKELSFYANGLGTLAYFWNVTVPQELLRGNPWSVDIAGSPVNVIETSNSTHAFLHFSLDATALPADFFSDVVSVKGTWGLEDTFPPRVSVPQRDPEGSIDKLEPVRISVNATDVESGVANATLYYLTENAASWKTQLMSLNQTTNLYEATVPGQESSGHVKYRIVVFDDADNNVTVESEYVVGEEVWVPSAQGAVVAATVTVGVAALVSTLASAATSSAGQAGSSLGGKIQDVLPSTVKKWLADSISSKRKVEVQERPSSEFVLTRFEVVSYAVTLSILTLAFAYAKSESLSQILESIPLILATSIVTDFVKSYAITAVSRYKGVWTEHRVWYIGLGLFAFSTLAFKVPFSSPSRLAHYSPKMSKRLSGLLSSLSVMIMFVFAFVFLFLYFVGYTLVGNIGLIMCLTGGLFDTLPIPPMGGKGIYDWNKAVWLTLLAGSVASYAASMTFL